MFAFSRFLLYTLRRCIAPILYVFYTDSFYANENPFHETDERVDNVRLVYVVSRSNSDLRSKQSKPTYEYVRCETIFTTEGSDVRWNLLPRDGHGSSVGIFS